VASTSESDPFSQALEELDAGGSAAGVDDLLERLETARGALLVSRDCGAADETGSGSFLCYRPGRSLGTGEAELASRGLFDVMDRPPLGLWLESLARARPDRPGEFELAVLVWLPPDRVERARSGRAACPNGSLAFVDELSDELAAQLARLGAGVGGR
jgi:hypothetical protein